ncbi:hypothetical protein H5P28_14915 [Ruficoccus amylovorans]|uniref:Translation initiation factor IF-2 n=1 Tax=Ruficoccus amylovorans TaxID=1804625 RepID=A0A842HIZ3_9BACT|nr:hypothetical protein [Ruficoccus amylovorans]MBC2595556.1 hypothetical protein [Ruficoccus amylovorans]
MKILNPLVLLGLAGSLCAPLALHAQPAYGPRGYEYAGPRAGQDDFSGPNARGNGFYPGAMNAPAPGPQQSYAPGPRGQQRGYGPRQAYGQAQGGQPQDFGPRAMGFNSPQDRNFAAIPGQWAMRPQFDSRGQAPMGRASFEAGFQGQQAGPRGYMRDMRSPSFARQGGRHGEFGPEANADGAGYGFESQQRPQGRQRGGHIAYRQQTTAFYGTYGPMPDRPMNVAPQSGPQNDRGQRWHKSSARYGDEGGFSARKQASNTSAAACRECGQSRGQPQERVARQAQSRQGEVSEVPAREVRQGRRSQVPPWFQGEASSEDAGAAHESGPVSR